MQLLQEKPSDLEKKSMTIEPFHQTLATHGLKLERDQPTTLQINMGLLCNQTCRHCHLDAGPGRRENMNSETADQIVDYAKKWGIVFNNLLTFANVPLGRFRDWPFEIRKSGQLYRKTFVRF